MAGVAKKNKRVLYWAYVMEEVPAAYRDLYASKMQEREEREDGVDGVGLERDI